MTVLLAPSADLAREVLSTRTVALTVEAEYGAFVAEGRRFTAAHHQPEGPYTGRHLVPGGTPSPCNDPNIPILTGEDEVVLVSHLDLDTFGGCLRSRPEFQDLFVSAEFWELAEWVDVRGAHKLAAANASPRTLRKLYAFWAWAKSPAGSPRLPRDRVSDVTGTVIAAGEALRRILGEDAASLLAGDAFKAAEDDLNWRTFVRREGDVLVRIADGPRDFCNHLYVSPSSKLSARAVASYGRASGAVTISLADPVPGVSCRAIVQRLWGAEAGGHDGIAGSPREKDVGEAGLEAAVAALVAALR